MTMLFHSELKTSESSFFIAIALPFNQQLRLSSKRQWMDFQSDQYLFITLHCIAVTFVDPLHSE